MIQPAGEGGDLLSEEGVFAFCGSNFLHAASQRVTHESHMSHCMFGMHLVQGMRDECFREAGWEMGHGSSPRRGHCYPEEADVHKRALRWSMFRLVCHKSRLITCFSNPCSIILGISFRIDIASADRCPYVITPRAGFPGCSITKCTSDFSVPYNFPYIL